MRGSGEAIDLRHRATDVFMRLNSDDPWEIVATGEDVRHGDIRAGAFVRPQRA